MKRVPLRLVTEAAVLGHVHEVPPAPRVNGRLHGHDLALLILPDSAFARLWL